MRNIKPLVVKEIKQSEIKRNKTYFPIQNIKGVIPLDFRGISNRLVTRIFSIKQFNFFLHSKIVSISPSNSCTVKTLLSGLSFRLCLTVSLPLFGIRKKMKPSHRHVLAYTPNLNEKHPQSIHFVKTNKNNKAALGAALLLYFIFRLCVGVSSCKLQKTAA